MQLDAYDKYENRDIISQQFLSYSAPQIAQNSVKDNNVNSNGMSADPISTIIAISSLIVSMSVAYVSHFQKAKIQLYIGTNIILFPICIPLKNGSGVQIEGIGFNLPITFCNRSSEGGTINRIRLVIGIPNCDDCYDMTWNTFVKLENNNFEDENIAQAISVEGGSSVNKVVRFDWINELGGRKFDLKAGRYDLRLYGWTQYKQKPDIKYVTTFIVNDQNNKKFEENVATKLQGSIWVSLDEKEKPNQLVSRNTIDMLYS
ncbi:hypothetical protein [Planktothricoides raciborskii]|uniref:Uncharacterized protein n=1 Tax=Planktothricoides raciborskii GIHE-MW2 TaxID=2792601 RepID=A0AAU8JFJ6_9CYAN